MCIFFRWKTVRKLFDHIDNVFLGKKSSLIADIPHQLSENDDKMADHFPLLSKRRNKTLDLNIQKVTLSRKRPLESPPEILPSKIPFLSAQPQLTSISSTTFTESLNQNVEQRSSSRITAGDSSQD